MKGTSLKQRLVVWLVGVLCALVAVDAWFSYSDALQAANQAYDRSLSASVKGIAERTYATESEVVVDVPYSALELFEAGTADKVYYGVVFAGGKVITGYEGLPLPKAPEMHKAVFYDGLYKGEAVRIGALAKPLYRPEFPEPVVVLVAETTNARQEVVKRLFVGEMLRKSLLVAVALLVVLFATIVTVKPMERLGEAIRARPDDDLTPVEERDIPREVRPLVEAINHHLARINRMLEARRRFITDAAHQLRTPLAVLNTQAEYALRQPDAGEMRRAIEALHGSLRQAIRLANQLLSLSRADPVNGLTRERQVVDLAAMARDVVVELLPLAGQKGIDLGVDGAVAGVRVNGQPQMLHELVSNLVDNALRYTPAGGTVTVTVRHGEPGGDAGGSVGTGAGSAGAPLPPTVELDVTDNGPGIPAAAREQVFLRFFRLPGPDHTGSGLGLSIVREIVLAHGGTVSLHDAPAGAGLRVRVVLPAADEGPASGSAAATELESSL